MRIVHVCLCGPYSDGFAYQENELVAQHVALGHEVSILASTETYGADHRTLTHLAPAETRTQDGALLVRLPYRKWAPPAVMGKLRMHPQVVAWLDRLAPEVILFHGLCSWELLAVARYKRLNPSTRLYTDCHEDFNNSARTWASKWLLHFAYYRSVLKRCLPQIDKVLCVTVESISFARDFYGVPPAMLELYPLGGEVLDDRTYSEKRTAVRKQLGVQGSDIVLVQSGKLDATKLLPAALRALAEVDDPRLRFVIAGKMSPDVESEALPLIDSDERVNYLGWLKPEALRDLLCAADVYVQPFGQTSTTQMSLCCRCAIVVQDLPSHRALFCGNGFLITESKPLTTAFRYLVEHAEHLEAMQAASNAFAGENLSYRKLARRVCA
jgi:1,2-diacylglycerol 3-alpha-glucosyltransferase